MTLFLVRRPARRGCSDEQDETGDSDGDVRSRTSDCFDGEGATDEAFIWMNRK